MKDAHQKAPAGKWAGLAPNAANRTTLSPVGFLRRAAEVYPDRLALVHGDRHWNYAQMYQRALRLASALQQHGVQPGDVVAVMLPNVPAMVESHFGVPMAGAVLCTINTRLEADTVAYILEHSEARMVIVDRQFSSVVKAALGTLTQQIVVVDNDDPLFTGPGERIGELEYEDLLDQGDPSFEWSMPHDEYAPLALNYTSGTTGRPKGVVYHHRGTFLEAMGNIAAWAMPMHPVYLWTLPLFHCNGWAFAWSTAAMGGTQVCLRAVDPAQIFRSIVEHGVTHMCGAPTVLTMLISAPADQKRAFAHKVDIQTGGSPPPAKVIEEIEGLGFRVLQIYGMTELQGPSTSCQPQAAWSALPLDQRADLMARQGVRYPVVESQIVADSRTCEPMPKDGKTIGEILIRSNTVMLGYFKDEAATAEAFHGGWMHTGDLAVCHPDNYIEIKDRAKDIIISGGENISSVEVEIALYKHPATQLAAVVARPDAKWGETPCAFVQLKPGMAATQEEYIQWCRDRIAHYKVPKMVVFGNIPTTATGKVQKFALREAAKSLTRADPDPLS